MTKRPPSGGRPRASDGKFKKPSKAIGHTFGNCSRKRALIKQRVHVLEQALIVQDDVLVSLMRDFEVLEGLVNDLLALAEVNNLGWPQDPFSRRFVEEDKK